MRFFPAMSKVESRKSSAEAPQSKASGSRRSTFVPRPASAFTLIEIAISLAVIGIALVAIIGVLPQGMNVQRENREATVVNQDATVFIEAITKGAMGLNDLTNYVFAITNNWVLFNPDGTINKTGVNGYSFSTTTIAPGFFIPSGVFTPPAATIRDGTNIIGLLSTPQFTDNSGNPINNLLNVAGYSNHIIAYVRSISGSAGEKPPQDNSIIRGGPNDSGDAFAYHILCVNALVANYTPPLWKAQAYNAGDYVSSIVNSQTTYWQAVIAGSPLLPPQPADIPGNSVRWVRNLYPQEFAANLHELRLTFFWPIQPNGTVGNGRQTYRTLVAGQVNYVSTGFNNLYFYQSQSFTNAP
jgi:type II secretory pathway pseudopilin PulG